MSASQWSVRDKDAWNTTIDVLRKSCSDATVDDLAKLLHGHLEYITEHYGTAGLEVLFVTACDLLSSFVQVAAEAAGKSPEAFLDALQVQAYEE